MDDVLLKETGLIWENGGHQTISAHTTRFFFGGSVYLKGIQQLCSFFFTRSFACRKVTLREMECVFWFAPQKTKRNGSDTRECRKS